MSVNIRPSPKTDVLVSYSSFFFFIRLLHSSSSSSSFFLLLLVPYRLRAVMIYLIYLLILVLYKSFTYLLPYLLFHVFAQLTCVPNTCKRRHTDH